MGALEGTLAGVSRAGNTLRFTEMNVQLLSGAGATDATPNGVGNLIIGYNKLPGAQTGSHNLILGNHQTFTSYGGLLAGEQNTISAPFASVTGGKFNIGNGGVASVTGGDATTPTASGRR